MISITSLKISLEISCGLDGERLLRLFVHSPMKKVEISLDWNVATGQGGKGELTFPRLS
jgi:hypothetical protein